MSELFFEMNFEKYLEKIKNGEHFKYSRYNDGELIAIIGETPNNANCDGHQYLPEMSKELKKALLEYKFSEDYVLESFKFWYDLLPHVKKILDDLKALNPELTFMSDDFIRIPHEQTPDKFIQLMDVLKTKKITIIGPKYLEELKRFFNFTLIEVPLINCYTKKDRIIDIINVLNSKSNDNYYLFSASMATNVIIDVFKNDNENTYLDWGSVWDTFFISPEYNFIRKRSTSNNDIIRNYYKNYLI